MKTFMLHVPYINVETSKIIGATEFCSSVQVSNSDGVIDFRMNYEQIPTKDAKSKHDVPSESNTFSVTDEAKINTKVNIQREDISQKNHLEDGKRGINRKSLSSNDITPAKTCNDSQSVGKRIRKRYFSRKRSDEYNRKYSKQRSYCVS